jgi:hypothetical protein
MTGGELFAYVLLPIGVGVFACCAVGVFFWLDRRGLLG